MSEAHNSANGLRVLRTIRLSNITKAMWVLGLAKIGYANFSMEIR
jgi:hypothetical protein